MNMSDFVIYLKLKPFIRQYLIHSFGDPVKFDDHSVSNARIISVLQKPHQYSRFLPKKQDIFKAHHKKHLRFKA